MHRRMTDPLAAWIVAASMATSALGERCLAVASRFTSAAALENQPASVPTATTFQPSAIKRLGVVDVVGKNQTL